MKRFLVLLAVLALPSFASAQLVIPLSTGNANCPFGGVSISVVTALPSTVQTSYVCNGAPGAVVRDASGDAIPSVSYLSQYYMHWDATSESYWRIDEQTGTLATQNPNPVYYDNSSCSGAPIGPVTSMPQYALLAYGPSSSTQWIARRPISLAPADCWGYIGGGCVYTGCPGETAEYEVVSPPSVSFGPLVLSR